MATSAISVSNNVPLRNRTKMFWFGLSLILTIIVGLWYLMLGKSIIKKTQQNSVDKQTSQQNMGS